MPTTGPNLGIQHSWASRESGWKPGMDANLKKLDCVVMLSIKDKDLTAPPGSPAAGDRYIVAASPTGAWAGQAKNIALYDGATWQFFTPAKGWISYVEDEDKHYKYNASSAWAVMV